MRIKLTIILLITTLGCFAKEKPIILWDLHGVLFHQHSFAIALLHYPERYQLLSHISWRFMKDLMNIGITNIEYLPIAQKYHNPYLQNFLLHAANNVSPIIDTQDIVSELAADGYEQQIASNINPVAFAQLINPHLHPEYVPFFALFNIPASQTAHLSGDTVIKKPDPRFFHEYLTKNKLSLLKRHIIFIDDVPENIKTAQSLGFDAILFKNPYQLRIELRVRGIEVAPPPYTFSDQQKSYIFSSLR